jgi:hypothetical protein
MMFTACLFSIYYCSYIVQSEYSVKSFVFWNVTHALLAACFIFVSCLAHFLTMKMEVTYSFETLGDFQWTAQCYFFITITVKTTKPT